MKEYQFWVVAAVVFFIAGIDSVMYRFYILWALCTLICWFCAYKGTRSFIK